MMENVSILNSTLRTVLALAVASGITVAGWFGWSVYNEKDIAVSRANQQLEELSAELDARNEQLSRQAAEILTLNVTVAEQEHEIARLDTSLRLLKIDHRVARLTVVDQQTDPDSGQLYSLVNFQELDPDGRTLGEAKQFRIRGDMVYVDSWVVKFEDKYVEEADIDRATSLVFFRRIFGEFQEPNEGFPLDAEGERPVAYSGGPMSEFESRIWDDFWDVANDESKQEELGIRAAHGDAPSIKVRKGKAYRIDLRASGGLSIHDDGPAPSSRPAA